MKNLLCTLLLFCISYSCYSQQPYYSDTDAEMQAKYWKYRDQLKKYFLKVGPEAGESMPCRARNFGYFPGQTNNDGPDGEDFLSSMRWADATIDMGYYISILATEYSLLERHGEDSQATLNELYYALKTIERLDFNAEFYLSEGQDPLSNDDINGLLLRDDVGEDFYQNFQDDLSVGSGHLDPDFPIGQEMNIAGIKSDFYDIKDNFDETVEIISFNEENVMSLDQLGTLLASLVTVYELVDHNAAVSDITGVDEPIAIVGLAQDIAKRIIDRIVEHDFKIKTWDESGVVPRGFDVTFSSPCVLKTAHRMQLGPDYEEIENIAIPIEFGTNIICDIMGDCYAEWLGDGNAAQGFELVWNFIITHATILECNGECGDAYNDGAIIPFSWRTEDLLDAWQSAEANDADISIAAQDQVCIDMPVSISVLDLVNATTNGVTDFVLEPVLAAFNLIDGTNETLDSWRIQIPIRFCFNKLRYVSVTGALLHELWAEEAVQDGLNHINVRIAHEMALASNIWGVEYINDHTSADSELPYLGLWAYAVNGGNINDLRTKSEYFDLLKSAPCTSPWANTTDSDEFAPDGWAMANRLASPGSAYSGSTEDDGVTPTKKDRGEFPGLDYMFMYNLYHLNFEGQMPEEDQKYSNDPSCDCILDITAEHASVFDFTDESETVLAIDHTITPKFADYTDKGISAPSYLSRNAAVKSAATLRVEEDLIICANSTLRITEGSRLVVQEGRQITVKTGSQLIIEDGGEIVFEELDDPGNISRGLRIDDGASFIIQDASFISNGNRMFDGGDDCILTFDNSTVLFDMPEQPSAGSGTYGLWTIGQRCTLSTINSSWTFPSEAGIEFGSNVAWESENFSFHVPFGSGPYQLPASLDIGIESTVNFESSLSLQNVNVSIDNDCDVDLKGCDVDVLSAAPHSALFSTDRYTDVHWNGGTSLTLNGDQSVFELGGMLKIHDGATFTFDYTSPSSGHIRIMEDDEGWWGAHFEPLATGSEIYLEGTGNDDLILELGHSADFAFTSPDDSHPTDMMTIRQGRVAMAENARINVNSDDSYFYQVDFIGASRGVKVYHENRFRECKFSGAGNGITGTMIYSHDQLSVRDSDFEQGASIYTRGGDYSLIRSNFSDAYSGIHSLDLVRPSTVFECTFDEVDYPIWDDASQTTLSVSKSSFNHSYLDQPYDNIALQKNYGQLNLRCNNFNGFATAVKVKHTSIVEAGTMSGGGYNQFSDNALAIDLGYFQKGDGDQAKLDLYKGYNTFQSNRSDDLYIVGSLGEANTWNGNPPFDYWLANRNYWSDMTGADVLPSTTPFGIIPNPERFGLCMFGDYGGPVLGYSCFSDPIYTVDSEPWTPNEECGAHNETVVIRKSLNADKGKIKYTNTATAKTLEDSTLVNPILYTASLDSVAMSDAILYAASLMEFYNDSTGNNMEAIKLFKEIITYDYDSLATEVAWLNNIAFADMKNALEHAISQDSISVDDNLVNFHPSVQDYVDVLMHRSADEVTEANYVDQFYLELDKAQFFRVIGKHELGHQLLLNLDNCPIDSLEQVQLNHLIYVTQQDILLRQAEFGTSVDSIDAVIDTTLFNTPSPLEANEFYFGAQILGVDQVQYTNCDLITWKSVVGTSDREFYVYPNPTSSILTIAFEQKKDELLMFEVRDLMGRAISAYPLSGTEGMSQVDIGDLADGTYLYTISNRKKVLESGQVVKQR